MTYNHLNILDEDMKTSPMVNSEDEEDNHEDNQKTHRNKKVKFKMSAQIPNKKIKIK